VLLVRGVWGQPKWRELNDSFKLEIGLTCLLFGRMGDDMFVKFLFKLLIGWSVCCCCCSRGEGESISLFLMEDVEDDDAVVEEEQTLCDEEWHEVLLLLLLLLLLFDVIISTPRCDLASDNDKDGDNIDLFKLNCIWLSFSCCFCFNWCLGVLIGWIRLGLVD